MKYIVGIIAGLALFGGVVSADCTQETPCGNGDPYMVTQAWGLNYYESFKLKAGESVKVRVPAGLGRFIEYLDTCPTWYFSGCMMDPKLKV